MKCNEIEDKLTDFIAKKLSESTTSDVQKHLNSCASCQKEFTEMESFLSVLEKDVPKAPSDRLRSNFEELLAAEKQKNEPKVISLKETKKADWKSYLRVAASVLLVVSAFLLGKYQSDISKDKIITAAHQQKITKQNNVLALIENQSASKRIQAIDFTQEFTNTDTKIIQAIINRLFFDDNTNVRLAAAEALSKFSSLEMVKAAFIKSLETEKDAIVQIELIQVLAKIQEKRALKPMKNLLKNKQTPDYVKQELQYNISHLL